MTFKETSTTDLPAPALLLEGHRHERSEVLRRLKEFLLHERARTHGLLRQGASGSTVTNRLTQVMDSVVVAAHQYAKDSAHGEEVPAVWIATGSYGRSELHPFSDVDLTLFYLSDSPTPYIEHLMSTVIQLLWDSGLDVSHACRNSASCLQVMKRDYVTASSLLEGRYVAGDKYLYEHFEKEVLLVFFSQHMLSFTADRAEEAHIRHRARGASPYHIEPNIKEDPGGLKDAQLISWILRLSQLLPSQFGGLLPLLQDNELKSLKEATDLLLRIRAQLHLLAGRRYDVLERALQEDVAQALGYRANNSLTGATALMRDYFAAAGNIRFHLDTALTRLENIWPSRPRRVTHRRPIAPGLVAIGDRLYFSGPDSLNSPWKAKKMMEVFCMAQRHHLQPSQQALKLIHEHLWLVDEDFRTNPEVAKLFMSLLESTVGVARALSGMRDCGLLGRYIPEFEELMGFIHYESPHSYTVDEHSLRAVGAIDELWHKDHPSRAQKRRLLEETGKQALLKLALLLHDIGKPRGPQHPLLGAAVIPTIARRLHLSEDDSRLLGFLVENHLEMTHLFEHRDHGEEAILTAFVHKVQSLRNLKLLYILTYADALASGRWFDWQDSLLWDLYQKAAIILSEGNTSVEARRPIAFREEFLELARREGMEREALKHCNLVPPRYTVEVTPQEAMTHLKLIGRLEGEKLPIALDFSLTNPFVEVWLSTIDRPARFSLISGVFAARGLDIISAQAYTRRDGIILDRFRIVPAEGRSLTDALCHEIKEDLLLVFEDKKSLAEMLRSRLRRITPARHPAPVKNYTYVRIDNKSSPDYTIIDVSSPDRVGLLYTISRSLAESGLDIHFAKVATRAGLAVDVFYVTDKDCRTKLLDEERIKRVNRALLRACKEELQ